jgi:hypothetical protein
MSNAIPTPPETNGMPGLLGHVMQASAVGVLSVLLCGDVLYLGPQREQRTMTVLQQQQTEADARYDKLLAEILANRAVAKQNAATLEKMKPPPGEP